MAGESSSYHHGNLRETLLDAARRLVEADGAGEVSLRAIAREAGVSPAAPYHHFESRRALLAAVAASGFHTLRDAMADAATEAPATDGPLGRLQAAGIAYVTFAVDHPELFRLMFSGVVANRSDFPELQGASEATRAVLGSLLAPEAGGETGAAIPSPALAAWSTVHGLAFLLVEGVAGEEARTKTPEEIAREVTRVLGRGLKDYAP